MESLYNYASSLGDWFNYYYVNNNKLMTDQKSSMTRMQLMHYVATCVYCFRWEEYVYLSGREPIMVNSNYYGMDMYHYLPTERQAARAATLVHAIFVFRSLLDREMVKPVNICVAIQQLLTYDAYRC